MQPNQAHIPFLLIVLIAVGGCQPTETPNRPGAALVTVREEPSGDPWPVRRIFAIQTAQRTWRVVSPADSTGSARQSWTVEVPGQTGREVADWLTAMGEIDTILVSPDGSLAATVSVGEGHPVLEVFDLDALAAGQRKKLLYVDPYPGTIHLVRWDGSGLWFQSEMDLSELSHTGRAVNRDPAEPEGPMVSFRWQPGLGAPLAAGQD